MKRYKAPTLTSKTPAADQTKLLTALKAVAGVEKATLHLATNEFEITAKDKQEPKRDDISTAASKSGFALAAR